MKRENDVHCHCSVSSSTSEEEGEFEDEDQTTQEQTQGCQDSVVTNEGSLIPILNEMLKCYAKRFDNNTHTGKIWMTIGLFHIVY